MVNCLPLRQLMSTEIVHGPDPLTDGVATEAHPLAPPTGAAATCPTPADVVGAVHPAGTSTVTVEPFGMSPAAVKVKVKLLELDAATVEGETAIEPSPSVAVTFTAGWVFIAVRVHGQL